MMLDEDLRLALRREAERQVSIPRDVEGIVARGRRRRQRRTALQSGLAAAAVVAAVMAMGALDPDTQRRTSPVPAATPSSSVMALPISVCDRDRACLPLGTYGISLARTGTGRSLTARLDVDAPAWHGHLDLHRVWLPSERGTVMLNVYKPRGLVGQVPCDDPDVVAPDVTKADVLRRMSTLPLFTVTQAPREVAAFGVDATHLRVSAEELRCPSRPGEQYNLADIDPGGDSDITPGQRVILDLWVLDVDGQAIIVEARQEGAPTQDQLDELSAVLDTLRIVEE
jgi:hypothetical protein